MMCVPHNAFVVVADGRKMLLLRNEGDAEHLNLQVERKEIHENPKDSDQKSDAAGRASSTQSGTGAPPIAQGGSNHAQGSGAQFAPSRGSMDETDYHQMEEDRFAAEVADILKKQALSNAIETLIVAAPPRTLGELRKHYHKEVEARIAGEIDKDLTGHTVPQIEEALMRA
jgi:protein required for attachment to host cells